MNERRIFRRKILRSCVIVCSALLVVAMVILAIHLIQPEDPHTGLPDETRQTIRYNGQWYVLDDDIETILVMGIDKYDNQVQTDSYNNDMQADFLSLLILDKGEDKATILHLNRDAMAQMNVLGLKGEVVDTTTAQLALAHTYGSGGKDSGKNTADAVSGFLYDVPVNHYISLTMDAVKVLNDLVGGVSVEVLDDFSSVDPQLVKGAKVTLKGEQALTYVRTRQGVGDETNEQRMKRQQQYMTELIRLSTRKIDTDSNFITKAALEISDYMVSDCTAQQLKRISEFVSDYDVTTIRSIEGESVKGEKFMEFYPDEEKLQELIIELFFEPRK